MKFRPYQTKLSDDIFEILLRIRRLCVQLATGGGKTVVFSGITKKYLDENPGKSVIILVHRKKLLKQTRRALYNLFNIECQVIIAGMHHVPYSRVYVGMVESVSKRIDRIHNIGLVIIDECHIASFNKIHKYFPIQKIIGFTATPLANSKKNPIKNHYEDIVCGIDIADLIQLNKDEPGQGLCQNITFAPKDVVDRAALAMASNGIDFNEGLMSIAFSKPKYINNTVDAYEKYNAIGTKTIVFNVNINHSRLVCDAFFGRGYDCKHIDSEMGETEQTHVLNWYHTTKNAVLCNVGILTTGFDEPSIETVIVNRATDSMPLWLQMCGRGSRPTPSKEIFTIIDLGSNGVTHGDWCVPRDWVNLFWNPPKPGEAKDQVAASKNCPKCDALIPAAVRKCKYCEYVFPGKEQAPEGVLDELVVITKGIDVKKLIEKNKDKKKYATFYEIGKRLAKNAKNTVPVMTADIEEFIYKKYLETALDWAKEHNHSLSDWHRKEAKTHLNAQLKEYFPNYLQTIPGGSPNGGDIRPAPSLPEPNKAHSPEVGAGAMELHKKDGDNNGMANGDGTSTKETIHVQYGRPDNLPHSPIDLPDFSAFDTFFTKML